MNKIIISVAMAALTVSGAAAAQTLPTLSLPTAVTPGIVGNTVQIAVGNQHLGAQGGLIGKQGTPSTVVGVGVLTPPTNTPVGSAATVTVPSLRR